MNSEVEIIEKPLVFKRNPASRAAAARMWLAWYYLIGIRATEKFDMVARAARVVSLGRNAEKDGLPTSSQERAR